MRDLQHFLVIIAQIHAFFDVFAHFSEKEASAANYDGATIVNDPAAIVHDPATIVHDPTAIVHDPATIVHDPATIVFIRGVSVLIHPMAGDGDLVFLPSHPAACSETMSETTPG